jgi:chromosome segregation protein
LNAEQKDLLVGCDAARADADKARHELQELTIEFESCRSSRGSAGTTLERGIDAEKQLTERIKSLSGQITTGEQPLVALKATLQAQLESKVAVDAKLRKRRQTVEQATEKLRLEEAKRLERDRKVSEIRETVDGMRVQVREFEVRRETVAEQFSKTGASLETVMAELPEDAVIFDWEDKLKRLQRRIDLIGNVNLLAIEEFEEQSERKKYLDDQFEDLTSALDTLEKAIRRIDRETRARFQETFENVNNGLKRIFPRLFGGGHAYLSLDGDDVLNAGVSVMARPPGKRISHIQLLSGGEKALTAVAMVFSIFELNPAPFCLLDEVDAPLDDSNVIRFCEIVREMSANVQFLFITHNKITMELAGQLMGVTMHEPGVSRLVSVDIDEAVRLAVS